jgi:predicted nucleic acid-binding protein
MALARKRRSTHISGGCVAMIEYKAGDRVYVDSNVWIYLVEGNPLYVDAARRMIQSLQTSDARPVTSELTFAECIWKPSKNDDTALLKIYSDLFSSGEVELTDLNGDICRLAATKGSKTGLKLLDAIHYVTALEAGCRFLVTSDKQFKSSAEMQVVLLVPDDGAHS